MSSLIAPSWRVLSRLLGAGLVAMPFGAGAQTDYFNTDRGRPLHVQDAIPVERYAFELQAAPLRWSRAPGARVLWSVEPELAYGILPRTQLEIGLPVFVAEGAGNGRTHGVGAVHVSVLHALNVESLGWPALALNLAAAIPAGEFGPDAAYGAVGGIATRTTRLARVHVNVDAVIGPSTAGSGTGGAHDLERWSAGVALDRAMPLRSLLVAAEVVAGRPMDPADDLRWRAGAGIRWQLTPYWAVDAGIGRAFGDEREWSLTFGAARAFGLVRLPRARR